MPKHSRKERESLKNSAFKLLDKGFTQQEVAISLNIHLRTLQRWIGRENYKHTNTRTDNALIEIADKATKVNIEQVEQLEPVEVEAGEELQQYHDSQRMLAIQMGELTKLLVPKVKAAIELSNPADIHVRLLPSLTRAITDLADTSSDCWARATGLEEVLNVIQTISTRQAQFGEESTDTSSFK
jgi:hypothetical protein